MPRVVVNKPQPLDAASKKQAGQVQTEFGHSLRALRQDRQLTIEQIAEAAGLHPNYVGSVERGERNVSLFNIWRLANSLDLTTSQLLEGVAKAAKRRAGSVS